MQITGQILDLARWAPSGDNTQPWRFEILAEDRIAIHGHDTRDWCLYDFDGHASHMAHGALLETLRIAATTFGLASCWERRPGTPDTAPIYDVTLLPMARLQPDPLAAHITTRTVQRRAMRTTPLTPAARDALRAAVGSNYELVFLEGFAMRRRVAKLLWDNARIRLTCPEAFEVHRQIIEWHARFSRERIPAAALGAGPLTVSLMRWAMGSWRRVDFMNRYLFGTVVPRIELDVVPALACAAHVLMKSRQPLLTAGDYVLAGSAMQRLWLTATDVGLHLQPQMTPVIFRWYARTERAFSARRDLMDRAAALADDFDRLAEAGPQEAFAFFCRVGRSDPPTARSLRLELSDLMVAQHPLSRAA